MASKKKKKAGRRGRKLAPTERQTAVAPVRRNFPRRYEVGISLFLLIAGLCVLYPELVFQNKVFLAGDTETAASFATPIRNAIAQGEKDPLWNPFLFSGMPSYGSLSYNPNVYPVGAFTGFLVRYLRFPNSTWLLFHIFLLGLGVFLLLFDRGVGFLIAAGAGILMMWMPNHVAVGAYGHGSQASAVAYIPFAVLLWDRLWRGKGVLVNGSALVIVLGFQLLRAHIQIAYYTFALLSLHVLFFGVLKIRDAMRGKAGDPDPPILKFLYRKGGSAKRAAILDTGLTVVIFGAIVAGALLLSAVLFLPVQDYAKYSIRGASEGGGLDYNYATSWSLHPAESLTFIIPFAFGFAKATYYGNMPFTDYPNYLGLIVGLFAIAAMFLVKTRFVRFLIFIVVVTTLVAFGKYFPFLYNPMFYWLPYFNKFRVPVMVLIVQQLAVVLLFAVGLSTVLRVDVTRGRRIALWGVGIAVIILFFVLITGDYWTEGFVSSIAKKMRLARSVQEQIGLARMAGDLLFKDLIRLSLVLLVMCALFLAYFRRVLAATPFVVLTVAIALTDLYMIDRHILHPGTLHPSQPDIIKDKRARDQFLQQDDVITFLKQDDEMYRVFPMLHPAAPLDGGDFASNRYMNFGIASVGGYHPAKLSVYNDFLQALGASLQRRDYRLLNMLGVRYLISSYPFPDDAQFVPVWEGTNYRGEQKFIYRNPGAVPRVFLVDRYEVMPEERILQVMAAAGDVDWSQVVLLDEDPGSDPLSAEGSEASITEFGFNEIRVRAKLTAPAILVLGEVFYPRWQVFVNGEPGNTLRANYILRAVTLPAGDHDVVFRYDDSLVARARTVSIITFLVAFLVLVASGSYTIRGNVKWKRS